ncbi:MAG: DUF4982 domain-containing protein [Opitutales bacterium]|nr:DUF4982 domain-containing protein [Opitutales bacterium]
MKPRLLAIPLLLAASAASAALSTQTLNEGWRFSLGEQPAEATAPAYNDSTWQSVRVPHDWAISGPFDPETHGYSGKLPWRGVGYYRTTLDLSALESGQRVYLDFDGVMAKSKVYVNGQLAGSWDYGYSSFRVDATPYVHQGDANVVTVVADTREGVWDTRWYPGAGIYRKVVLQIDSPLHIAHWGQKISHDGDELSGRKPSVLRVGTKLENHDSEDREVEVETVLISPCGKEVARSTSRVKVPAKGDMSASNALPLGEAILWDIDNPALYTVQTLVRSGSEVLDTTSTRYGVRTFAFTADDGFHLNGRRVQLKGVNLHSDLGPLGMAFNRRAAQRQLEIMQDAGVNALRTSHNPPAPEVLDLCDEMGIVVWDEVFDKWNNTAGRFNGEPEFYEFGRRQVQSMVLRDRNHPSVVVWSVGNEILEGGSDDITPERTAYMAAFVKEFDQSRPVGMANHIPGMSERPNFEALDLTGWNYARRYWRMHELYPEKPIIYSESASAVSTRGYYEPELPERRTDRNQKTLQVSSYDMNSADWSDIADVEFALMEKDRFVSGEFVWTGIDYLGEPTPFDAEARSSYFGFVDLCGLPKDRFYLYRSHWRPETPTVHILPHWNWEGREGRNVPVFVYTNGHSAELFLNGKSLGKRVKGEVPERAPTYPIASASATSSAKGHAPALAADGDEESLWRAAEAGTSLTLDLGKAAKLGYIALSFENKESLYAYALEASSDGKSWLKLADKPSSEFPLYSGPREKYHTVDATARYLRLSFGECREGNLPAVRGVKVYPEVVEPEYYDVSYQYRLRWNEVAYEAGELKAVAYDAEGNKIGEQVMRTAGAPAQIRLTPDRTVLDADGNDLAFITVEALDKDGTPCPLADNMIEFTIEGAGELAGAGNGNPMSFESFVDDEHSLFYGKAVLIVRAKDAGEIEIEASAKGLETAIVKLIAKAN